MQVDILLALRLIADEKETNMLQLGNGMLKDHSSVRF